jgi:tRNA(fMet)-specific endonuclease VapC
MDTAKLFASGRSQAVRLPKAYRLHGKEVGVRHFGSGVFNRRPPAVLDRLAEHPLGAVGVSSITAAELAFGVAKSGSQRNRHVLEKFLAPLEVAPFDLEAMWAYGRLRAALEQKGRPIGSLDPPIAAHALALGATLVTNNVREFARVPGLKIENWAK